MARNVNRLRILRATAEPPLTQLDLIEKLNDRIKQHRLWKLEVGHAVPTPSEIALLAKFFKVAPEEVFPVPDTKAARKATA